MHHVTHGCLAAALMFAVALTGCERAGVPTAPAIIPRPQELPLRSGSFPVGPSTVVVSAGSDEIGRYFIDLVGRTSPLKLKQVTTAEIVPGRIKTNYINFLQAVYEPGFIRGMYDVRITPDSITVTAPDRQGLFYGAITVWQLLSTTEQSTTLPELTIYDGPRFQWRGLMLDSARHYQSPAFIKQFIDWMALHKLNVLHWHLTDDQAWRLEIRKYPRLASVGGWRVPAGQAAQADIDPATRK